MVLFYVFLRNYTMWTVLVNMIKADIRARTVYGARHGLETLRQLIVTYKMNRFGDQALVIAADVQITDEPVYAYRGFMLDTSRNYFPLSTIKRTLDAMGHSKLNVFHWHATDSHSFPLDLPSAPQMAAWDLVSIHIMSKKEFQKKNK